MIVHRKPPRFVYLDPPKTGTRSAQAWLLDLFPGAQDEGDHRQDLPERTAGYVVLTTVRNPYERAISAWVGTIRDGDLGLQHREGLVLTYGDASIESFARWLREGQPLRALRSGTWPLPNLSDFLAPFAAALRTWSRILPVPLEGVPDKLTRLPFICRRMAARFPHRNRSRHRPSLFDMSPEFVAQVNAWAEPDFDRFDYQRIDPSTWRTRSGGMTPKPDGPT